MQRLRRRDRDGMGLAVLLRVMPRRLATLLLLPLLSLSAMVGAEIRTPAVRLLQAGDLAYVGAFRLPATGANGDDFSYGGTAIAYNPGSNSLFVGSRRDTLAEVTIPTPVQSPAVEGLPSARYLQPE